MCCIFTCCGWIIDLIQRCWTFTMSCVISSAVCCAFFTTSMSGIALGYNYSLAEYLDLKETNVSVYIKRGVFDDDVADDMGWRRSGHQPVSGLIRDQNLLTAPPSDEVDESKLTQSGRRMDDSIFESDDKNKFEGSLMKLTARPPYVSTKNSGVPGLGLADIRERHHGNTLDQLKDIKAVINMRKSGGGQVDGKDMQKTTYTIDDRYLEFAPSPPMHDGPGMRPISIDRRRGEEKEIVNPRDAVPEQWINEESKWFLPKLSPEQVRNMIADYGENKPTYPPPVTYRAGPKRPPTTRPSPTPTLTEARIVAPTKKSNQEQAKDADRSLNEFREDMMLESLKNDEFMKMRSGGSGKSEGEDYDDVKGLPVRKKRSIKSKKDHKFHITADSDIARQNRTQNFSKPGDIHKSDLKVNGKFMSILKRNENIFRENINISDKNTVPKSSKYKTSEISARTIETDQNNSNINKNMDTKVIHTSPILNKRTDTLFAIENNGVLLNLLRSTVL